MLQFTAQRASERTSKSASKQEGPSGYQRCCSSFFDTRGVFRFESKHEGVRQRENAIGGVDELKSSHKKNRAKHRPEQRDRDN